MKQTLMLLAFLIPALSGCVNPIMQSYTYNNRGNIALMNNDPGEAIVNFQYAAQFVPDDGETFFGLGKAYFANDQPQEAIDAFKKGLSLPHQKTSEVDTWGFMSLAYASLNDFDAAISAMKQVTERRPDVYDGFAAISVMYTRNKQYDQAIKSARRAIELKPDIVDGYLSLWAAYHGNRQYDEALQSIQKAVEINPKHTDAYLHMADVLITKYSYKEAIEASRKAIEISPSEFKSYTRLAVAYYRMGRYDDAIAAINKPIENQINSGRSGLCFDNKAWYPVINKLVKKGPAQQAGIQIGDSILKVDGKSIRGWTDEQISESIKGVAGTQVTLTIKREGNTKPLEIVITRNVPDVELATVSFAIRSILYRYKGDLDKAFNDAEKASSLDANNDWSRIAVGVAHFDRGENDAAIKFLSKVEDSPIVRLFEATAYAKQGKLKEAATIYLAIPGDELSLKDIPLTRSRTELLQLFKPFVTEYINKAAAFAAKGQDKETLSQLSEALKLADEAESSVIQDAIFGLLRKNPSLSVMPDDARKHAIRSEVLVKEGNFAQAAAELRKALLIAPYSDRLHYNLALISAELKKYPEAITHMNTYLKAAPSAPDTGFAKDSIIKWEFEVERASTL